MFRALLLALVVVASACSANTAAEPSGPPGSSAATPTGETVSASYVLDGDSVEVQRADGTSTEVRLLGINAPEGSECHGEGARQSLESMLTGSDLILVRDEDERDQFGRLLRYVYSGGVNVNLEMVAGGDALAVQSGHSLETSFLAAGAAAAGAGRGLWAATACGHAGTIPEIEINRYEYNPAGRDADNPNDEWVVLANRETVTVALGGWILRDESTQHRFVLPEGFQLNPGDEVTIHSGCGPATVNDLYWCAGDPVWSNGGDTIILQLPDGTIVAWEQFFGEY